MIEAPSTRIIAPVALGGGRIAKEDTPNSTIIQLGPQGTPVLDKCSASKDTRSHRVQGTIRKKDPKWRLPLKHTIGSAVHKKRGSEDNLPPIELRDRHPMEKTPSNIHDVFVLTLRNPVLLMGVWKKEL